MDAREGHHSSDPRLCGEWNRGCLQGMGWVQRGRRDPITEPELAGLMQASSCNSLVKSILDGRRVVVVVLLFKTEQAVQLCLGID